MNTNIKQELIEFKLNGKNAIFIGKRTKIKNIITESNEFKQTKLYKDIVDATSFLPKDTNIFLRIKAILQDINKMKKCYICGNDCKIIQSLNMNVPFFSATCNSIHCRMSHMSKARTTTIKSRANHSIAQKNYKKTIIKLYKSFLDNNNFKTYGINELKSIIVQIISQQHKNGCIFKDSYFKSSDQMFDVLKSIFLYTKFIQLPTTISNKKDLCLHERAYCILNDIKQKKVCKYCQQPVKFLSLKHGYALSCKSCIGDKFRETIGYPTLAQMKNSIDVSKYEIISFPKHVTSELLKIRCKKCGHISEHMIFNGIGKDINGMKLCKNCEKYISKEEKELRTYVKSICQEKAICNSKSIISPYELDIYIPKRQLAIEFDGLYWHNDNVKDKSYHLYKTRLCEDKGIQLIHIFENEWLYDKEIVKSRIKNLLGIYDRVVFARNCIVKEIKSNECKKFLNENHIQHQCQSSLNLGLYYDNILISIMAFGKCRFDKKHEWELLRFCNKLGYHIPGGASKLLKHFERAYCPKSLVSYADRRWSQGKLYEALGFKLDHISGPNYWYYKNGNYKLMSRINFQKHKLCTILEKFDNKKTEIQNMKDNGYLMIYDCGNLVYEKIYEKS